MTLPLPHGDVQPSEVRENFEEIARQFPVQVPTVTALPATAANGTRVSLLADSTNGIRWTFEYNAASSSAYKWEFVGGPAMRSVVATSETTTSTTYTNLATTHSLTLPAVTGDFVVEYGCGNVQSAASTGGYMSVKYSAAEAVDADGMILQGVASRVYASMSRNIWVTVTASSQVITARYRVNGASTQTFYYRHLAVTPVRAA